MRALHHQLPEAGGVGVPFAMSGSIVRQHLVGGREFELMLVADVAKRLREIAQIVALGEARQLRGVMRRTSTRRCAFDSFKRVKKYSAELLVKPIE